MKKIYMLSALMCASVFSFTGCIEETFENPVPANDGDEIVFGARAGFENRGTDTKTIYAGGGGFVAENDFYSANGKKFERIDWIDGTDRIQISCPEAGGVNPAHYLINDKNEQDNGKNEGHPKKESTVRQHQIHKTGLLHYDCHQAGNDCKKAGTLYKSTDDKHRSTDVSGRLRLTRNRLHSRRSDLSDTESCSQSCYSSAYRACNFSPYSQACSLQ